ncbi:hypothetical protein BG003_004437 [Podila horticola]|nr:hypothetical protein BG003_004437 [Podila horticola]
MVCHTWHSTLAPVVWRDFSWYSPAYHKRNPDHAQILTNARHIQTLAIHSPAGPTSLLPTMASHLTRLTTIWLPFLSSEVLQVIQHCRETLVDVGLLKMDGPSGQIFNPTSSEVIAFWDLLAACPRLTSLALPDAISSSKPNSSTLFIRLCQQLTALSLGILRPGTLPPTSGYPSSGFPQMRDLSVHTTIPETNLVFIAQLFARCPQTTRLRWQAGNYRRYDMEYAKAIRAALEPLVLDQLEEMIFDMDIVQDATVAQCLLPKMPRLHSLSLDGRTYAHECHAAVLAPARASLIVEPDRRAGPERLLPGVEPHGPRDPDHLHGAHLVQGSPARALFHGGRGLKAPVAGDSDPPASTGSGAPAAKAVGVPEPGKVQDLDGHHGLDGRTRGQSGYGEPDLL